jgi:hypothetical protein
VKSLISGALTNIAAQTAGLAAMGLSAGFMTPAALAGLTKVATKGTAKFAGKSAWSGMKAVHKGAKNGYQASKSFVQNRLASAPPKLPDNVIPFRDPNKEE